MGNKTSNSALNNPNSSTQTLTDVHRKCVKTFSGTASEDVERFVCQLQAVSYVYKLSDQLLLELTLEKIEGQALEWLHSRPDLMTLGIDHFKRALLKEFGKIKKVEEQAGIQNVPSAPPKTDVCAEEMQRTRGLYPEITDFELQLDNLRFDQPPPRYEAIFSGIDIQKQLQHVPQTMETPRSFATPTRLESVPQIKETHKTSQKIIEKEEVGKKPDQKKQNTLRAWQLKHQNVPIVCAHDEVLKLSGARPKIPFQKTKAEPEKETSVPDLVTPLLKCNYCKDEGHHIRDCKNIPRCHNCGEKFHKIQNCPSLAPGLLGKPSETKTEAPRSTEKDPSETPGLKCHYCKAEGHFIRDCKKVPRCGNCGDISHRKQNCPLLTESEAEELARDEQKREGTKPLRNFVRPERRCYRCNSESHRIHACPFPKPPE